MRHTIFAALGLAALLAAGASQAQVDYSDIKAGTMLDGKGIRIGAFIKPVPLPPGDWLVVHRGDNTIRLSGGDGSFNSTNQVLLTLKSTDSGNGIYAIVMSFSPDSLNIRWQTSCMTEKQRFTFNITSSGGRGGEGCGWGQLSPGAGMRNLFKVAANHATPSIKARYGPLTPYADESPEHLATLGFSASRTGGRILEYAFYAQSEPNAPAGGTFEKAVQAWLQASTQSAVDMLNNTATAIPPYPTPSPTATGTPASLASAPAPTPVKMPPPPATPPVWTSSDALQIGSSVSKAIALEPLAKPMPLPPGTWVVVGRMSRDIPLVSGRVTSEISLTLKNADPKADLAVLVLAFNPERFTQSISTSKCDLTKFPILEDYGTTAESEVYACTYGRLYTTGSFKQRVMKAATTEIEWDKKYLSPLEPYAADMPEGYLWLWFTVKRADTRRLSYTLFGRVPAKVATGDKFDVATRAWIQSTGQGLMDFLRNKDSAIAGFPDTNASP